MEYESLVEEIVDTLLGEEVRIIIGHPVSRDLKTGLRYRDAMHKLRFETGIENLSVEPVPHGQSFAGYAPEKKRVTSDLAASTGLPAEKIRRETGAVHLIGLEPAHPAYGGVRAQKGIFAHEAGHWLKDHPRTDAGHATGEEEVTREAEAWNAGEAFARHAGLDADMIHREQALNSYRMTNGLPTTKVTPEEDKVWRARTVVKYDSDEDMDTLHYGAKDVRRTQGVQREHIRAFAAKHGVNNPL